MHWCFFFFFHASGQVRAWHFHLTTDSYQWLIIAQSSGFPPAITRKPHQIFFVGWKHAITAHSTMVCVPKWEDSLLNNWAFNSVKVYRKNSVQFTALSRFVSQLKVAWWFTIQLLLFSVYWKWTRNGFVQLQIWRDGFPQKNLKFCYQLLTLLMFQI